MTDPVSLDVHTNPEAHDPDGRIPADMAVSPALQAIETALTAAPGRGTVEAKAQHIHDHLARNGWALIPEAAAAEGNVHVLGPDEQIVTVPDGATVSIHPPGETALYGPAVAGHPDLEFLAVVCDQLDRMAPDARERVAAYLTDRYGPVTPPPVGRPSWLDVTRPPGHDLPLRTGGVIGRPQATRISE